MNNNEVAVFEDNHELLTLIGKLAAKHVATGHQVTRPNEIELTSNKTLLVGMLACEVCVKVVDRRAYQPVHSLINSSAKHTA